MLSAGALAIAEQGLSLSLEHISMEDLIVAADVSRTSSYRRWPTKDAFAADLLLHIAQNTRLTSDFTPYADALKSVATRLLDDLADAQGRRNLVVEGIRILTATDFEASLTSDSWRSYIVLRTAHGSLPAGDLRDRLTDALRTTERRFVTQRAASLATGAALVGYRLSDPDTIDWAAVAELTSASFAGMIIRAFADPQSVLVERRCAPFGSTIEGPWTLASLASATVFFSATEPDPSIVWDGERIETTRAQLVNVDDTLATIWAGLDAST